MLHKCIIKVKNKYKYYDIGIETSVEKTPEHRNRSESDRFGRGMRWQSEQRHVDQLRHTISLRRSRRHSERRQVPIQALLESQKVHGSGQNRSAHLTTRAAVGQLSGRS